MHQPCSWCTYVVLVRISPGYPPVPGMSLTRYAPLRRSPPESIATSRAAPRLACVRPAASVHPEPGSNSSLYITIFIFPVAPVLPPVRSPGRNRRSYFFGTFSCLLPVFSMNFLFQFFPLLSASLVPLVPNGIAKVLLFSLSPTFFQTFLTEKMPMPRNQLENMWIHKKSFGEKILKKITAPTKIPYMPRNEKIRGALNPHSCGIGFPGNLLSEVRRPDCYSDAGR